MCSAEKKIYFYQGLDEILDDMSIEDGLEKIKQKIAEFSNIKNVNFLLGAGTSSDAIPSMEDMEGEIADNIKEHSNNNIKSLYDNIASNNLENILNILHAKKYYLEGISNADEKEKSNTEKLDVEELIKLIEDAIYSKININLSDDKAEKTLGLYKQFYQKTALRNKDLSRVNIFTTNNDLFNEKALDTLSIDYNNGFGGGLERVFNPARFHFTFSKKIDINLEKFEPLENMIYLYKLHGSISWIQQESNSLFDIYEHPVTGGESKKNKSHVLIYPTPLKEEQSLGPPYADLIREFQTKLSQPNSAIFIIGYSFRDEHLNKIIYRSLMSNSSISVVIFGKYNDCPLAKIDDSRIYRIHGENDGEKIHYFEYIVKELLPNVDENANIDLLDNFASSLHKIPKSSDDTV